jgi:hypothetical protein
VLTIDLTCTRCLLLSGGRTSLEDFNIVVRVSQHPQKVISLKREYSWSVKSALGPLARKTLLSAQNKPPLSLEEPFVIRQISTKV